MRTRTLPLASREGALMSYALLNEKGCEMTDTPSIPAAAADADAALDRLLTMVSDFADRDTSPGPAKPNKFPVALLLLLLVVVLVVVVVVAVALLKPVAATALLLLLELEEEGSLSEKAWRNAKILLS